jgi:YVTN family beta-propeller protein
VLRSFLILCTCMASALHAFVPTAYVCNAGSGSVSPVEVEVTAELPVGHDPSAIAITPDQSTLCVCNRSDGTVSIINLKTNITATVTVGGSPTSVAITPDGTKACVCNLLSDTISIVALPSLAVMNINVSGHPSFIAILPNGSSAYVSCDDDTINIINLATLSVSSTIPLGNPLGPISITPDGSKVCVASTTGLYIIDPTLLSVVPVPLPEPISKIATTPDNTKACLLGNIHLFTVDLGTLSIQSAFVGSFSPDIAVSPDSSKLYVTQSFPSGLSVFSLNPLAWQNEIGFGHNNQEIALTCDGTKACISDPGTWLEPGILHIIDLATLTLNGEVVGAGPNALVITSPTTPTQPSKFVGEVKRYSHKKRTLCLRWTSSSSQDVAYYEIFASKKKIATIPATFERKFHKPLYSPFLYCEKIPKKYFHRLHEKYKIRSVSSAGLASPFRQVKIKH